MKISYVSKIAGTGFVVAFIVLSVGYAGMNRGAAALEFNPPKEPSSPEMEVNRASAVEPDAALKDFQTRCQTPGVLKCVGFDDDTWFQQGVYLSSAWDKVYRGTRDTTVKASGDSSLRFEFPGHSPANGAGSWTLEFGKGFAQNSSFFVQYRMRLNDVMAKTDWDKLVGSSWKQSIFHSKGTTCASIEITTTRYSWNGVNGFPVMYTECGGRGMSTNKGDPPSKFEQGGYNCWYSQFNAKDCFFYPADVWLTFYYSVSIGDWGKPNSYVQAWVAPQGKPLKKWIDMPNFILNKDSDSSNYNSITLLPYMTAKKMSADHAPAYMWFDELIISTQPIPAPAGQAP
jgi:hypothetical protein